MAGLSGIFDAGRINFREKLIWFDLFNFSVSQAIILFHLLRAKNKPVLVITIILFFILLFWLIPLSLSEENQKPPLVYLFFISMEFFLAFIAIYLFIQIKKGKKGGPFWKKEERKPSELEKRRRWEKQLSQECGWDQKFKYEPDGGKIDIKAKKKLYGNR